MPGRAPPPGPDAKQPLRDLSASGPGPSGLCLSRRSPTLPSPFVPHSEVNGPKRSQGSGRRAVPSPQAPGSPAQPLKPSKEWAVRKRSPGSPQDWRAKAGAGTQEARSTTGIVIGREGPRVVHLGKQILFLLGPAVLYKLTVETSRGQVMPLALNLKHHLFVIKASPKIPFLVSLKFTNLLIPHYLGMILIGICM